MIGDDVEYPDEGYDEFLDAARKGAPEYVACENDHAFLPPRRVCPDCGSTDFEKRTLPDAGEITTYTVTHVASPRFAGDTPYTTAVADFGPLSMTAQVRGVDPEELSVGTVVTVDVDESETTGDPVVIFRPR
jgi:uncharacterized OB-fold protein